MHWRFLTIEGAIRLKLKLYVHISRPEIFFSGNGITIIINSLQSIISELKARITVFNYKFFKTFHLETASAFICIFGTINNFSKVEYNG